MSPPDELNKPKRWLFTAMIVAGIPILAFALLESGSSLVLLAGDLWAGPVHLPERRHSKYDPELGWVGAPNLDIPDMYGKGRWLRTNAQGFRGERTIAREVPPKRIRVICSGDSFAFGYGVSNDRAWCELLGTNDPRLEPVNMGQSGYGVDQAYLWYLRDGVPLDHHIHLFTFIWGDFTRMRNRTFDGYPKPVLVLKNGVLEKQNVPVPETRYRNPRLTAWARHVRNSVRELRSFQLAGRVRAAMTDTAAATTVADSGAWLAADEIFRELDEMHRSRGSALVLVHFPDGNDELVASAPQWAQRVWKATRQRGINYIDLEYDLRQLPPDSLALIFRPGDGHYTELGNEWVARRLLYHLRRIPDVSARLGLPAEATPPRSTQP